MNNKAVYYNNLISMEAHLEADMQSIITRFFPRLGDALRDVLKTIAPLSKASEVELDSKRFLSLVEGFNYLDLQNYSFAVPNALNVDYLTYVGRVEQLSRHSTKIYPDSITPLRKQISELIGTQSGRFMIKPNSQFEARMKARQAIERDIHACFSKAKHQSLPWAKVVNRNSDWVQILAAFKRIQAIEQIDAKQLNKDVEELLTLVDTLIDMAQKGELQRAAKEVVVGVSDMIAQVADDVALISVEYYHRNALTTALSDGIDKFIKDFR